MNIVENEPNWLLVTENYEPPSSFSDLLYLLIPNRTETGRLDGQVLSWKEKEFYKKETIIPFIQFAFKKMIHLPKFNKDEMPTVLRIVRLCQETGWYGKAYELLKEQKIISFIFNSLDMNPWDNFTKAAAWNYIIVKQKAHQLEKSDELIWEKIKYDLSWKTSYDYLASEKEIIECKLLYVCRRAKEMEQSKFEEIVMELAMYCNSKIATLYTLDLVDTYKKCMNYFIKYIKNQTIIDCHYAILAQLAEFFYEPYQLIMDDYMEIMKDIMTHIDYSFYYKYKEFIGMLLSYIPFFQMIHVRKQTEYFQEVLNVSKGVSYKEEILREYVFSQVMDEKGGFLNTFYYHNCKSIIEEILTYWCTPEQRNAL
ncbi:DUF3965 domain-containing protein [Ectobacillus polymachus]|uniref:DUF3965 domain-containing protein n=1 Tax=Ectobacillus polymachus TaxID=1508806 RepID=UPI003A89CBDA